MKFLNCLVLSLVAVLSSVHAYSDQVIVNTGGGCKILKVEKIMCGDNACNDAIQYLNTCSYLNTRSCNSQYDNCRIVTHELAPARDYATPRLIRITLADHDRLLKALGYEPEDDTEQ